MISLGGLAAAAGVPSCSTETSPVVSPTPTSAIPAGEICTPPLAADVAVRAEPSMLVVPPGATRTLHLVVDPDVCQPLAVRFASSDGAVVATPGDASIDYAQPTVDVTVTAGSLGVAELTVAVARGDGTDATATVPVEVLEPATPSCSASDDVAGTPLAGGGTVAGAGTLTGARIALPQGADAPNAGSFVWSVAPFTASLACAEPLAPAGYRALGPAVTFGPADLRLKREIPLSVPLNPALLPAAAHWRHVRLAYSGPRARTPRTIPVTDPRVEKVDGQWALTFAAPWLGTYQAVVPLDAGTVHHGRRLTHRAVIGLSMGAAGAAQLGLRHHELFDVVAALGGPVDWTWLGAELEQRQLGGFRPIAPGTTLADIQLAKTSCSNDQACQADEICLGVVASPPTPGKCTLLPPDDEPYAHSATFDDWWGEVPGTGNGANATRARGLYLLRDLALAYGDPIGFNPLPGAENLPAGIDPDGASQTGDHAGGACKVWVDPLSGDPAEAEQQALAQSCPTERCGHVQTLQGYYDGSYNPDGTFPVITFCDGAAPNDALSPYANSWASAGNDTPLEVGLAVDYNGNGVRDELEPVIRAGHEHWNDWGSDDTPSALEPGYGPDNLDPAGDDYHPQYNPTGTEGNHRHDPGESFDDTGLDGVMGTSASPYDFGEGDGVLTVAPGLARLWEMDPRSMLRGWTETPPVGPLDDEALGHLDLWTDGGTRDPWNFAVAAQHLAGGFVARNRDVSYFADFSRLPGLDPSTPDTFLPGRIAWADLPGVVLMRYGKNEPSADDIASGSGQHLGTPSELTRRLQSALYFAGSRWPDAPRARTASSSDKPDPKAEACELAGSCSFEFTASFGRKGPVTVTLPPGYAHADLTTRRYPVIYLLHGYEQSPEDLQAAVTAVDDWMNGAADSQATRLPQAILVYVDGRCRAPGGTAECFRGTFFADSVRADGPQLESWWLELMDYVDQRFRTMGEGDTDWVP